MIDVVILSAGRGRRIGQDGRPQLSYKPKPLLTVAGETLIQRQVRLLNELGVTNIMVVAGDNEADIKRFVGDRVKFLHTDPEPSHGHKNALYELAEVCKVIDTGNNPCGKLLVLLGDLVFSKKALKEMIELENDGITVFGSGDYRKLGLSKDEVWWNRAGEIFAVKLTTFYIKLGRTLFGSMPDLYYELKNIPKQLNIPVIYIKECHDIDHPQDLTHARLTIYKFEKQPQLSRKPNVILRRNP